MPDSTHLIRSFFTRLSFRRYRDLEKIDRLTYTTGTNLISRLMMKGLSWKRLSLSLAIVIVLNLFFNVGVRRSIPRRSMKTIALRRFLKRTTKPEMRAWPLAAPGARSQLALWKRNRLWDPVMLVRHARKSIMTFRASITVMFLLSFSPQEPFHS